MRRRLRLVVAALLILLVVTVTALLSRPTTGEPFHPDNPQAVGGQALARVLADQGVEVQVVSGSAALADGRVTAGPGTTVLLPDTRYLGPEGGPELLHTLRDADHLVVLVSDADHQPTLGLPLSVLWTSGGRVAPDCGAPFAVEGDLLSTTDALLSSDGGARAGVTACYPPGRGHNLGGAREGAVLTFPADRTRPATTVASTTTAWSNAWITQEANAALALRLLGGSERLVWVLPQPGDAGADAPQGLWPLLPDFLTAWVWLGAAGVLALAVWQGRRLGPVVTEPLPAVVHASETTRSRGRLYRQARDRDHALAAAREGTRWRLTPPLGLPRTAGAQDIADAAAATTGRPQDEVRELLLGAAPADDDGLVRQVRALRELEDEVTQVVQAGRG